MKLLGLSCGSKLGNSEVLLKEALMGAEEVGVAVAIVRLVDLNIRPCKGCKVCAWRVKGECILKDDAPFIQEQLLECDGLIVSAPVYILTPPGYLKLLSDRVLNDVSWLMEMKKMQQAGGGGFGGALGRRINIDERAFKNRVGAFISLGGASTPHWLSFGLPLMHMLTFPRQIEIVDQMQVPGLSLYGNAVMNEKALARARKLGRNVAEAMKKPISEVKWMGDDPGTCPVCHSNLLTVGKKNPVECPVCGISGTIKVDGDKITVTFSEKERKRSRLTIAGKLEHWIELRENSKIRMQKGDDTAEIAKRLKKYESYKTPLKPTRKSRA